MSYSEAFRWMLDAVLTGRFEGIFALVFFCLSFALLGSLVYQLRIRSWPACPGTLVQSSVANFGGYSNARSEQMYRNEVGYEYAVGGSKYVGERLSPWHVTASHNMRWVLRKRMEGLAEDGVVKVFYNPTNPSKSFLTRPGWPGLAVTVAFMVFCLACPVLIANATT